MRVRLAVLGALLLAAGARAGPVDVKLCVVEGWPAGAQALAAAAEAGLRAEGAAGEGSGVRVLPVEPDEALAPPAQVCAAAADGAHAVIGGVSDDAALSVAAAGRAGLPLLLAGERAAAGGGCGGGGAGGEALALFPRGELAAEAARQLAHEKGWRRAALLHAGAARAAPALSAAGLQLLVRRLPPPGEDPLLRDMLLVLKKADYVNFMVWSDAQGAVRVLDAAQRVGLLAARHSYILTSLELHTQQLANFSHGGANITGLMIFDPDSESVQTATKEIREAYAARLSGAGGGEAGDEGEEVAAGGELEAATLPSALLLAYDAARLTARALAALDLPSRPPADCPVGRAAFHASTLLNYLRAEEAAGTTGVLAWEADGARRGIVLQVVELARGGWLEGVGTWSAGEGQGVSWRRRPRPAPPLPPDSMANRTFNILIAMNPPYVMRRESTERLSGNDRYEGFCIELIEKLAQALNFNYTFIEQWDNHYGSLDAKTGTWDGMLYSIMTDDNMHFAITDLTITEDREKAVDFTTPFMNLGISILFKKPKPPEPALFAFLLPFSSGVWLCLGLAYVGSSLVLFVVGRLCPEEWQNPYPCVEEPAALENQFTLGNAFWFNLGAVLLQGSEIAPVAYGTRAVASVWWLFALVITSSYTANLATLLAQKSSFELIKDVRDLAHNDLGITYGAKKGGSTYNFFENSQSELYQEMFRTMQQQKMPEGNDEGINKVMTENYAFLMESTSIEYVVERNCFVYMVGELLDSKGYGIAMKKNSPYRQEMNLALLRLQEKGTLREMKTTWWEERHGGGACKPVEDRESSKLEMNSFQGLFLVLVVGCSLGVLLSCADLAAHAWKTPRDPDKSFSYNFAHEMRFVFRFDRSDKPLQGPLIESKSESPRSSELDVEDSSAEEEHDHDHDHEQEERGEEAGGEGGGGGGAGRVGSGLSGPRRRRRSSMHTASMKLARHAPRD